ncbi:membrane-associated sensor protein [Klebsiella oxytoca]|uniref:Membrane-associated sensor protein n=1 Tax=Klebsiella oxytoca TaxID=571 RepID=A0A318FSD3_KLEOX|nr:membrane-associated sensor protein [Klebsiella oxytoca]
MPSHLKRLSHPIFFYTLICIISIIVIDFLTSSLIHRISTTSPTLFPVMTISLMSFHITIACFMAMKYLCDKKNCTWPPSPSLSTAQPC